MRNSKNNTISVEDIPGFRIEHFIKGSRDGYRILNAKNNQVVAYVYDISLLEIIKHALCSYEQKQMYEKIVKQAFRSHAEQEQVYE